MHPHGAQSDNLIKNFSVRLNPLWWGEKHVSMLLFFCLFPGASVFSHSFFCSFSALHLYSNFSSNCFISRTETEFKWNEFKVFVRHRIATSRSGRQIKQPTFFSIFFGCVFVVLLSSIHSRKCNLKIFVIDILLCSRRTLCARVYASHTNHPSPPTRQTICIMPV